MEPRKKTEVAIESSAEYPEPEYGFVTDEKGNERYRLITLDNEGYEVAYPSGKQHFSSEQEINDYIRAHADELEVISRMDMDMESIRIQREQNEED